MTRISPLPLCVPTNFQRDYLDRVDLAGVEQVYGKLDHDPVGGGRASAILPAIRRGDAVRHIRAIRDRGVSFNYLLNASCLGNTEFSMAGRRRIDDFLAWLSDAGVDTVTVTIPYLLEIVKQRAPHLKIAVSTITLVDSPESAHAWEALGADKITLSVTDINRDFGRLRRIRTRVDLHLQLLANLDCLQGCPYRGYHGNLTSHASRDTDPTGGFVVDWCYLACSADRLREPARLIMAGWIRPEDQHHYRAAGIDSLKIVSRAMTSEVIGRVVAAYRAGRHDGNLLDLFSLPGTNLAMQKKNPLKLARHLLKPRRADLRRLWRHRKVFDWPTPRLDNRALDGFLDHFLAGRCDTATCGTECRYCWEVAQRAFVMDDGERRAALARLEAALADMADGSMFRR